MHLTSCTLIPTQHEKNVLKTSLIYEKVCGGESNGRSIICNWRCYEGEMDCKEYDVFYVSVLKITSKHNVIDIQKREGPNHCTKSSNHNKTGDRRTIKVPETMKKWQQLFHKQILHSEYRESLKG